MLATLKHIASKNADYGAAEEYLTFEHDEFTMKPTLDANGHRIPRENYRIAALNCGGEDFAIACMRTNLRYGKNQKREDVKSHHYIISFDPRDGPENGLTMDKAQALGEAFCAEHFPGHQALVCTHADGHNHSGNIHVHIVINSVRIADVPLLPYMNRPADTKAGMKHRCTDAAMEYFKSEVMELCHREGLYQIDLLNGSGSRVTEREYWAARKQQATLDRQEKKPTRFETDKEKLRREIRAALREATTFDAFAALLARRGITVKESRGRLSYLTPDRTKPITARRLGDDFDRDAVLAALEQNAKREKRQPARPTEKPSIREQLRRFQSVQRVVDIEAKRAEGKGVGYERWAKTFNLKQEAAALMVYQQHGFSSLEEMEAALSTSYADLLAAQAALHKVEDELKTKTEMRKHLLSYRKGQPLRDELKALPARRNRDAFRQRHKIEFADMDADLAFFKARGITKLPPIKTVQAEIEALIKEKNRLYVAYRGQKQTTQELQTVRDNIRHTLSMRPKKQRDAER